MKLILLSLLFPALAFAHGDDDHSHDEARTAPVATAPSTTASTSASALSRIETATETFELVAQLTGERLVLLLDRFETNEPVLEANLEVELNGAKARAQYRADHGDYVVEDKAVMSLLAAPGAHSLVFTVAAGKDADLLEATMEVGEDRRAPTTPAASGLPGRLSLSTIAVIAVLLTIALTAVAIVLARRKPSPARQA